MQSRSPTRRRRLTIMTACLLVAAILVGLAVTAFRWQRGQLTTMPIPTMDPADAAARGPSGLPG